MVLRPAPPPSRRRPLVSPSDLARCSPGPVRVAGRLEQRGENGLQLADALDAVAVSAKTALDGAHGDLVVLDGVLESGRLTEAELVERHRPAEPPPIAPAPAPCETKRLRHDGVARRLVERAAVLGSVRDFFARRQFVEVDTPLLVRSPGLDLHLEAFSLCEPLDRAPAYLITSPEYHMKRLLAGGLPRIFQLAHCFRRGEVGALHNPEFMMLEWYRAFATVEDVMADTEELVRWLVERHAGRSTLQRGERTVDLAPPFLRLTVAEAFSRFAAGSTSDSIALASEDGERFFRIWVDELEPALAGLNQPVFVHDFPASLASLARRKPAEPHLCERFELYLGGVELCNGFGELTDPVEQRQRLERDRCARTERGQPSYPIDERFLGALREGMPPAGGNALGMDRLIALCTNADSIADVQSFPQEWL